jgi:hypothetical protein
MVLVFEDDLAPPLTHSQASTVALCEGAADASQAREIQRSTLEYQPSHRPL